MMETGIDFDELVQVLTQYSNMEAAQRIGASFLAAGLDSPLFDTVTLVYLTIKNKPSMINCAFQLELFLNILLKNQEFKEQRKLELAAQATKKRKATV